MEIKYIVKKYGRHIDIALGIIVLYCVCFNYSEWFNSIASNYYPVWSDEFFYFINTYSFIQNETLEAALTFGGKGSVVFGADAHGFGYPLLQGSLANIFSWSNLNFIYFNLTIVLIAILFIWFLQSITINQKLWISCIFLLFPFFPLYAFTYMQEAIHIFIATIISILIYHVYHKEDNRAYIAILIIIIFISGVFRSLWFFWLIGLLPLAKSKRELISYGLLFISGIILSVITTRLFTESVPNYFNSIVTLLDNGQIGDMFVSLFSHFYENIKLYFFNENDDLLYRSIKYINFGTVFYFAFQGIKSKSRLAISLALIGILNFLLLFLLYDAFDWREIRTMSPLFYFYILFIVLNTNSLIRYLKIGGLCFLFSLTIGKTNKRIAERNNHNLQQINKEQNLHKEIADKVSDNSVVLVSYIPRDYSYDLLNLPVQNSNGSPVRYIIQYYNVEKVKADYVLSRPKQDRSNSVLIDNEYYRLIENK